MGTVDDDRTPGITRESIVMTDLHARHWIGGEWLDAAEAARSVDPATGLAIGTYSEAGEAEACRAVEAAYRAFLDAGWRGDRRLRAWVLNQMADQFEEASDDLVEILSLENGKVKGEARFEVGMVPSKLRFYAALTLTEFGRAMETAPNCG
jgi:betaine-aldehyde dehydrogenase